MQYTLPALVMKADTVGVFIPSVDENTVEKCLDKLYASNVSELAVTTSDYRDSVSGMTSFMSKLGLLSPCLNCLYYLHYRGYVCSLSAL